MDLFGHVKTRQKPRTMMHVSDAGNGFGDYSVIEFECRKCGHNTGWIKDEKSVSENKRGMPCPNCNPNKTKSPAD